MIDVSNDQQPHIQVLVVILDHAIHYGLVCNCQYECNISSLKGLTQ